MTDVLTHACGAGRGAWVVLGMLVLGGALSTVPCTRAQSSTSPGITRADPAQAQRHWSTDEGLPVQGIRGVTTGPQGYLWLATYGGLVRFDGVSFDVMTAAESGLPNNRLEGLQKGPADHLWASARGGYLIQIDPSRRAVRGVYGSGRGGVPHPVTTLAMGRGDALWLGTRGRLYRRPAGGASWAAVGTDTIGVVSLERSPDGGVWVGTETRGLWRARRDSAWAVATRTPDGNRPGDLPALAVDSSSVWAGGERGGFRLDGAHLVPLPGELGTRKLLALDVLPGGTLWADAHGVLFAMSEEGLPRQVARGRPTYTRQVSWTGPQGARWTPVGTRLLRNGTVVLRAENRITAVHFDPEGNAWIATAGDGLYRLRPTPIRMVDASAGLPVGNVYGVARGRQDPSSVYVGSIGGGLARVVPSPDGHYRVTSLQDAWELPAVVWTAHEDRQGTFWIGTTEGLYRRSQGRTSRRGLPPGLQEGSVRAVFEDRSGRLWVLHGGTLYVRRDGTWRARSLNVPASVGGRAIAQAHDGSVWIGTDGAGLLRVRGDALASAEIRAVTQDEGLPSTRIRALWEDPEGPLWIGTGDGGLSRLDRQGTRSLADDSIVTITRADGLPDNTISQLLPDDRGRLWASTNRGIFRIQKTRLNAFARGDAERVRPAVYTGENGLNSREANGGAHPAGTRTPDGRLWVPTQEGVAVIDPSKTRSVPPPPAAVEAIATADTTYRVAPGDTVRLRPDERTFTARYAGLHFANPDAVRFHVQLGGVDRALSGTRQRSVRYTGVEPGTYSLTVQATHGLGKWGPPAGLTITVLPFWWETWWFYGLCGLGVAGLMLAAYRWRTRRIRRRQDELERAVADRTVAIERQKEQLAEQANRLRELDEAKSRFFANISHELRTPLTLIRGPVRQVQASLHSGDRRPEALEQHAEHLEIVDRNAARLQRLVDRLLGLARLEAGTYELAARRVDPAAETRRIADAFEPLADRQGLALTLSADAPRPGGADPLYVDPEALEHVVSNLLSNALKFTPEGGRVDVVVQERAEAVAVAVRDTGPGIPEDQQDVIFDRFGQADGPTPTGQNAPGQDAPGQDASGQDAGGQDASGQDGAGIGLAFARELVNLHGGTLSVDSSEGEGTTFTARFPRGRDHLSDEKLADGSPEEASGERGLAPEVPISSSEPDGPDPDSPDPGGPDEAQPQEGTPQRHRSPGGRGERAKRVLIVDDNADVRRYVASVLAPTFETLEAAGGAEGTAMAREHLPDVILADVRMPGLDGHEMTRRLKEAQETEAIPVIMLTARASTEGEVAGLQAGADDYVTKPFDADVLRQRIDGIITMQQRLRRRLGAGADELDVSTGGPSGAADRPELEQEARRVVRSRVSDPDFGVSDLARELGMSRSTLYRRFNETVEKTPAALITEVRIEKATALLRHHEGTVTQVAYAVGFERLSNFSDQFAEHTGVRPSTLAK